MRSFSERPKLSIRFYYKPGVSSESFEFFQRDSSIYANLAQLYNKSSTLPNDLDLFIPSSNLSGWLINQDRYGYSNRAFGDVICKSRKHVGKSDSIKKAL